MANRLNGFYIIAFYIIVFYEKGVLKICSKFTGFTEHPWVFYCKFAAYCQHLWVAASVTSNGLKATNIFLSVLD